MDVRIGVTHTPKELDVELDDDIDQDVLCEQVEKAVSGESEMFWLTDKRGRRVGIPTDKIAYVDIGASGEDRRVGFGT